MPSTNTVPAITADTTVGETLRAFPATTVVFLRRRMHCPGCHMASFMTLREAAASYGVATADLLADLRAAIR